MEVLVTGGAGFIGSNLAQQLVDDGHRVRVLDDLSTGYAENVPRDADLVHGDVADEATVRSAIEGVDLVFHQAAARSVQLSVETPLAVDTANIHGTLTLLVVARDAGVRRVVNASSSSIYGGAGERPSVETAIPQPRSPYAVSKLGAEHYCRVFSELHGLETVSLRYFNVYGPRQRPDSAYAAVIPLFIAALQEGRSPVVYGDGRQSRDFTFVDDVVRANLAAATAPADSCSGRVFNVAGGRRVTLLDLLDRLGDIVGVDPAPEFLPQRPGDVRHSEADASAAARDLGWRAEVSLDDGLRGSVAWLASR
jgi:UDP-glucose 4-epimerase